MSAPRRHRVAVLLLPGVLPLEFGAVTQIFARDPHYDLAVCAQARTVPGSGFTITTAAGLEGLVRAETVIVPGYEDVDAVVTTAALDALRAAHAKGVRLVSICTGASPSPRLASSMDVARRRIGDGPTSCSAASPRSRCCRTASSSTTATFSRPPVSPRASICASI